MTDHYRHAGPSQHPARDLADGAQLSLALAAVLCIGIAVIIGLAWANVSPLYLLLAFLGFGAALTGLFRLEARRTYTDVEPAPAEEDDRG